MNIACFPPFNLSLFKREVQTGRGCDFTDYRKTVAFAGPDFVLFGFYVLLQDIKMNLLK